jgi:hypothetical protein
MTKKTIGWIDTTNKNWDVHIRADIDNPTSGFTPIGDGRYTQVLIGTKVIRTYTTLYDSGDDAVAESTGKTFRMMNEVAGHTRLALKNS